MKDKNCVYICLYISVFGKLEQLCLNMNKLCEIVVKYWLI